MTATAPVTVERAAAILGVAASTVRQRIRDGTLRAESVARPQGVVWLVHLPPDAAGGAAQPPPPAGVAATAPVTAPEAMIAYTRTLLEPLVAALERSQDRAAGLERENGELATRLAAADERIRVLEAPKEPEPSPVPEPLPPTPNGGPSAFRADSVREPSPWWRRAWAWLATP